MVTLDGTSTARERGVCCRCLARSQAEAADTVPWTAVAGGSARRAPYAFHVCTKEDAMQLGIDTAPPALSWRRRWGNYPVVSFQTVDATPQDWYPP